MKLLPFFLAATLLCVGVSAGRADECVPGTHDAVIGQLLQTMARSLSTWTTTLRDVAPEYFVEAQPGLSWTGAVAVADARFGQDLPRRAIFLRKYVRIDAPVEQLEDLHLQRSQFFGGDQHGISVSFDFGPPDKRLGIISVSVPNAYSRPEAMFDPPKGKIIREATLALCDREVNGVVYTSLEFDASDRLRNVWRTVPLELPGYTLTVAENPPGDDGSVLYWASIFGRPGYSEEIEFTTDLKMRRREVSRTGQLDYVEVYEDGKLRRRKHYGLRQNALGGTDNFVTSEENYP